ncbi:MAG: glycosyltransferase family 4 protein [Candidatus Chisholmbacteria bacterium]|nr:glycosyltransferase family 4 protein [Candidatus Chisholmbacteria bacterium]
MKSKRKIPYICFFGTYDRDYTSNRMILDGLKQNGVKILEVNANTKVTKLTTKVEMSWLAILSRILKKYRIVSEVWKNRKKLRNVDVIYVGYPGHVDVLAAYIVAKIFRKKLVFNPLLIIYNGFADEQGILNKTSLLGKAIKFTESLIYNLCDVVFADTPFQHEHLRDDFGVPARKLRVLPIGADSKGYVYTPYKNTMSKKVNVVYYGLYSPIHGVEHIIEAARLLRSDPDVRFTMIGQGNTFKKNYARAKKLGLKNITFYHDIPESEHLPLLQSADIFLGFLQKHPTVDRVIPNKVYQGLALGRVVLTADSPVTRSVFSHKENAYLCKPADPMALVVAINTLKNDPELRTTIAANGYQMYKKSFTPKAVGKQLVTYIQEIL